MKSTGMNTTVRPLYREPVEQLNQDVPKLIQAFEEAAENTLEEILRCPSQSQHLKTAIPRWRHVEILDFL